jgi:NAD+ synthase
MLAKRIAAWMRGHVRKALARGILMGLSGGIDSAVVAVLAKMAVRSNVLGLLLPCHSAPMDEADARLVARAFNIKTRRVNLSGVYDMLLSTLPPGNRIAAANLKPRLRMLTLYYFANEMNYLVAGTGNRSEISVGYFTKFGDGGADIFPLGGLLKRDVCVLARELGIPQRIINKLPTAGLWAGQTDEGEMGITYDKLDAILAGERVGGATQGKVKAMIARSEHKRRLPGVFHC